MEEFKHLGKNKMKDVDKILWETESSLNGLGALFQAERVVNFSDDELFGIGQLIKGQARQVSVLGNILRCGDSKTKDS